MLLRFALIIDLPCPGQALETGSGNVQPIRCGMHLMVQRLHAERPEQEEQGGTRGPLSTTMPITGLAMPIGMHI